MASRSFMDTIRGVVLNEGAKDKTSDGMTKDAKHFAQDLHKVQDSGMKYMVQKDSETKDYEKMFSGNVEKAPTRLADLEPSQGVDKYVEYNEAVEARKKAKKDDEKVGDQSDAEDATGPMSEIYVNPNNNTPAGAALRKSQSGPNASTLPNQAGQGPASPMRKQGTSGAAKPPERAGLMKPSGYNPFLGKQQYDPKNIPAAKPGQSGVSMPKPNSSVPAVKPGQTGVEMPKPASSVPASKPGQTGVEMPKPNGPAKQPYGMKPGLAKPGGSTQQPYGMKGPSTAPKPGLAKPGGSTQQPYGMKGPSNVPKPTIKPTDGGSKPKASGGGADKFGSGQKPSAGGSKPQATKPGASAAKPNAPAQNQKTPAQRAQINRQIERNGVGPNGKSQKPLGLGVTTGSTIKQKAQPKAKAPAGTNPLKNSYEIEWNGNSYVMNEAQIQALDVFIEKYGLIEGTAGEFIKKEMEHPEKLTAKGNKQKVKQSLAIYYSKKRHGENP